MKAVVTSHDYEKFSTIYLIMPRVDLLFRLLFPKRRKEKKTEREWNKEMEINVLQGKFEINISLARAMKYLMEFLFEKLP